MAALPDFRQMPAASLVTFGPVLVDDRDHAERHPDAARCCSPLGRRQPSSTSPIGSGSAATGAQAVGHARDAGVGEAQAVERTGFHPGRFGGLDVEPVRRQQVVGALVQQVGGGEQGGVLLRGGGRRQRARRAAFARRPSSGTARGADMAASVPGACGRPAWSSASRGPGLREG